MDKEALFEARTNPDFLKYLEEARINSMKAEDIGLMYETLDSMLILDLDEENVNKLYEQILKTSFANVDVEPFTPAFTSANDAPTPPTVPVTV